MEKSRRNIRLFLRREKISAKQLSFENTVVFLFPALLRGVVTAVRKRKQIQ